MVSHDLEPMETLCSRVLWIENGRVIADGAALDVIGRYRDQGSQRR